MRFGDYSSSLKSAFNFKHHLFDRKHHNVTKTHVCRMITIKHPFFRVFREVLTWWHMCGAVGPYVCIHLKNMIRHALFGQDLCI